uniref:Uncharacterized protein n=1 Tax=viral metagenome TaxID=1070528 RepID=A0A6M3L682_9ZZZZ
MSDIDKAIRDYRRLHGGLDPDRIVIMDDERHVGQVLVSLGRLDAVVYATEKDGDGGELTGYVHEFGEGEDGSVDHDAKPLLCIDPDSGKLAIVGGAYRVNYRGIVG